MPYDKLINKLRKRNGRATQTEIVVVRRLLIDQKSIDSKIHLKFDLRLFMKKKKVSRIRLFVHKHTKTRSIEIRTGFDWIEYLARNVDESTPNTSERSLACTPLEFCHRYRHYRSQWCNLICISHQNSTPTVDQVRWFERSCLAS